MRPPEYFKTLELPLNTAPGEIKKVYRRLARKYHPDHHPNDPNKEETFKKINEPYSVWIEPTSQAKVHPKRKPRHEKLRQIVHWEYDLFRAQIICAANETL